MTNFICLLDHWQSLAGAFVGGFSGLIAALVVAGSANRREQRAAAMLIIVDLTSFGAAGEALRQLAKKLNVPSDKHHLLLSNKLAISRPKLSPLFEASMVRVMTVDDNLSAHLSMLKIAYNGIEESFARLRLDLDTAKGQSGDRAPRTQREKEADSRLITMGFERIEAHAKCADMLMSNLIFSRFRLWHRIRMQLRPNDDEKECVRLLREGVVKDR